LTNIDFFVPTKIIFGEKRIIEIKDYIDKTIKNILLVTGKKSAKISGALDKISRQLNHKKLYIYDKVEQNPCFETVEEGAKIARKNKANMIIGIGGGSPMDAAKGIALLATNFGKMSDYMAGKILKNNPLPIACIPLTSGTGSEVTPYAVFTDKKNKDKGGYSNPKLFPEFSIVDPELTESMPEDVKLNTGVDALSHAIEAYFSIKSNTLNDLISLSSIEIISKNLLESLKNNKKAIIKMSYASMLAGIAIANAGTLLLHAMGYPLTVYYNIPHGKANGILFPVFMEFMSQNSGVKNKINKIENIFSPFGGISGFLDQLGISTKLSDYEIDKSSIEIFVKKTINKKNLKRTPGDIKENQIYNLYKNSF